VLELPSVLAMAKDSGGDPGPWHLLLKANDASGVEALLAGRADPLAVEPPFGWTPLHSAAGCGATECCGVLLKAKADAGAKAEDGETPLHLAAQDGKEQAIRLLVEARAQVDATSAEGETPLHVAVQHLGGKGLAHVRALVELRADVSACDAEGRDARTMARLMTNRPDELMAVLGGGGAESAPQPERTAAELEQVLRLACRRGQAHAVPRLLAQLPAGTAPAAAARSLVPAAAGGSVEVAEALLVARADVRGAPTDERGTGPLVAAADEGSAKMVRWLLSHGADPDAASMDGATALMAASGRGASECVSELLAARASPDVRASGGWTSLMLAARGGRAEVVRALLDAKAQVDAVAQDGSTARKLAADSGRSELVKVLDTRQRLSARRAKAAAESAAAQAGEEDTRNLDDLLKSLGEKPNPKAGAKAGKRSPAAAKAPTKPAAMEAPTKPAPAAAEPREDRTSQRPAPAPAAKGKAPKAARAKAVEARLQEIAAQRAELEKEEEALRAELVAL